MCFRTNYFRFARTTLTYRNTVNPYIYSISSIDHLDVVLDDITRDISKLGGTGGGIPPSTMFVNHISYRNHSNRTSPDHNFSIYIPYWVSKNPIYIEVVMILLLAIRIRLPRTFMSAIGRRSY